MPPRDTEYAASPKQRDRPGQPPRHPIAQSDRSDHDTVSAYINGFASTQNRATAPPGTDQQPHRALAITRRSTSNVHRYNIDRATTGNAS
jgi:hypothetical protein